MIDSTDLETRLRSSAKAFRENTVYDSEGDPLRLIVQADESDEASDTLASYRAEITQLRDKLARARDDFNYLCKWVERGLFDEHVSPTEALKCIAHHPGMPWKEGRWDVDHKPYAKDFYDTFPLARQALKDTQP